MIRATSTKMTFESCLVFDMAKKVKEKKQFSSFQSCQIVPDHVVGGIALTQGSVILSLFVFESFWIRLSNKGSIFFLQISLNLWLFYLNTYFAGNLNPSQASPWTWTSFTWHRSTHSQCQVIVMATLNYYLGQSCDPAHLESRWQEGNWFWKKSEW